MNKDLKTFLLSLCAVAGNLLLGFVILRVVIDDIPVKSSMSDETAISAFGMFFFMTALTVTSIVYLIKRLRKTRKTTPEESFMQVTRVLSSLLIAILFPLGLIYTILSVLFFSDAM